MLGIDPGLTGFDIDPDLISSSTMDPAMTSRQMIALNKALELDSGNFRALLSNPKDLNDVVCDWIREYEHSHLNRNEIQHTTTNHKIFGITQFSNNQIKDCIKVFRGIPNIAKKWINDYATCDEKYSTKVHELSANQLALKHLYNRCTSLISTKFSLNTAVVDGDDEEELELEPDNMAARLTRDGFSIHNGSFVSSIAATSATAEPHQVMGESLTSSGSSSRSTFIDSGYHTRATTIDEDQNEHSSIDITKSAIDGNLTRKRKENEEVVKPYKKIKINITNKNGHNNKNNNISIEPERSSTPEPNHTNKPEDLSTPIPSKKPKIIIKNNGNKTTPLPKQYPEKKKIIKIKFNSASTARFNLISNWEVHNPCADPWADSRNNLPTDTEPFPEYIEPDPSTYA